MSSNVGLWAKAVIAAAGASLTASLTALQDGHIETWEWATIILAGIVALAGVKAIHNATSGALYYAKAGLSAVIAAAGVLVTALADQDGVTSNELVMIVLALLTALPVGIAADTAGESDEIVARRALVE
jgi:phosphatidylserine synthase